MTNQEILKKRRKQSDFVRKMTVTGMLSAITAILTFTPIGMITLPPPLPAVTMVHIPVLLGALVEGPGVAAVLGLVFGLCSFIRAWETGMIGLTLFFRNPLVSILPRILFPLMALLLYWLWKKLVKTGNPVLDKVGVGVASAAGAICNTVLCLGMIILIYGADLTTMINGMIATGGAEAQYLDNAGAWLVAVVGVPNGVAESIVAAILVPILKTAVDAVNRRTGRGKARAKEQ